MKNIVSLLKTKDMNRLLLLPFSLMYNFIRINIGKSIVLATLGLSIYGIYTVTQYKNEKLPVIAEVKYARTYLYIVNDDHKSVLEYSERQKITNNKILHQTDTGTFTLCVVLTVVMGIIFVILLIASIVEDDVAWDLMEVFHKTISVLIECELEDGKYHYTILGRLISMQNEKQYIGDTSLAYRFDINNITTILNLPKFKTKTEKRSRSLDKLGI
jgi:hypothetical protein